MDEATLLPDPPDLGPPASWFHAVWIGAPDDDPVEWFDELDAERWSIRCVRKFRDGSLKAYSYASPASRHQMPEVPIPPLEEINENTDFTAKEISKAEFEAICIDPLRSDHGAVGYRLSEITECQSRSRTRPSWPG